MKIGVRLALSYSFLLVAVVLVGIFGIINVKETSSTTTKLYRHPYAVTTTARRIETNIISIHRAMKDIALSMTAEDIEAAAGRIAGVEKDVYRDFDTILDRFLGDKAHVEKTRELFSAWRPILDRVISYMKEGELGQASALEETSSSLEQMASMTNQNAANAEEANGITARSHKDMADANEAMIRLTGSMEEISKASRRPGRS